MAAVAAFFTQNIVFVYFLYGLAFFALGIVVFLESSRASEFRFARALRPLAAFGFLHGLHEWYEMFQVFAAHESGHVAGPAEEIVRVALLAASFLCLMAFGMRLLPDADGRPALTIWRVAVLALAWLAGVFMIQQAWRPNLLDLLSASDVLARYSLGIPSSLLTCWALLRERRDFHARGMSPYGRDLLWAGLAFFLFGSIGQMFTRPSLLFPSEIVNTALFVRLFGIPVQLFRGMTAVAITVTLGRALRAFELESRLRLQHANEALIEAQASALAEQARRMQDTEALNQQLRTTARELAALVEMSHILASTMDLRRLLQDSLYQIVNSFELASCSVIFLRRPDGGLELAAKYRRPNAPHPQSPPPLTRTAADAFKAELPAGAGLDGRVQILDEASFAEGKSYRTLAVPLHAKGLLFGGVVLTALCEGAPFGSRELGLLVAFGQQLATSVENATLYQTLQERETRLEELVRQLVTAQENERQRIARELHDETGQKLTAIVMGLAAIEPAAADDWERAVRLIHDLRGLADQSITELRNIMSDLRPSQLDDLGLVPALRWYVQGYGRRNPGIKVQMNVERPLRRLPAAHETTLFRVAQEALTNIARHAHASEVNLQLCQAGQTLRLKVIDNGIGFDPSVSRDHRDGTGWGLMGMRERVALLGGSLTIESQRGVGTHVTVELPLEQEQK